MQKIIQFYNAIFELFTKYTTDFVLLFLRLYVADAFLRSGISKFNNWDTTLYLFENEYKVPFISWELAAYIGTVAEIILPIMIVLGFTTRLMAFKLFIFNIVAVISYPAIWDTGYFDHKLWGVMLLVNILYGGGAFSTDRFTKIK